MVDPHVPSEIVENEVLNSSHFFSKFRTLWLLWVIFLICSKYQHQNLVGGLEHFLWLSIIIWKFIIPTDFHSIMFQRAGYTTNQKYIFGSVENPWTSTCSKSFGELTKKQHKKNPATQAWEEAQKRPPPIVQAAKAKAQRSPTWLAEAGLWVIWLDDELDSHCWSWEAKDCRKKHVNPVEIDWDDGSWPNLVRM